ncbi:MAG: ABC transporter substrate-binding protein, partial [Acetobacteraceae bacterium]|nr:ABC transporter substrate-binding protein [Acetobacteraceae bacterium]
LRLRDGLLWHDGERVLARDCTASIRRWAKRDPLGEALMAATDELSAPDDRTIRFRLNRPFALLPDALGKAPSPMPAMMPQRLAESDPFKPIAEIVGSGPFRFVASERVAGARNVFARFDKYKPRADGAVTWTSGPKVAHFDRVEWTTIPDPATASAAILSGEQDYWETAVHDTLPVLRRNASVVIAVPDPTGNCSMMRANHLQKPFSNPAIRRALLYAIDQNACMQSFVGDNPEMISTPLGTFPPRTPLASDVGLEPLQGPRDLARVKEMLKQAGYAGEKVVLIVASDYAFLKSMADVLADTMQRCGMNVDYVLTDWGTMLQRRNKKDPVDQGGWSVFVTNWAGLDHLTPATHIALRGNGDSPSSWPGWCISPKLEELRTAWFAAPDLAAQQVIGRDMQRQAMTDVPYWPLGQFFQPIAYRKDLTGVLPGFATFWNIRRAG